MPNQDFQLNQPLDKPERERVKTPLEILKRQAEKKGRELTRMPDGYCRHLGNGIIVYLSANGYLEVYKRASTEPFRKDYYRGYIFSLTELDEQIHKAKDIITESLLLNLGFKFTTGRFSFKSKKRFENSISTTCLCYFYLSDRSIDECISIKIETISELKTIIQVINR